MNNGETFDAHCTRCGINWRGLTADAVEWVERNHDHPTIESWVVKRPSWTEFI